ncbi:Zn-dependent exopeptidase [Meredithblackwellia eburnea MCA 4105]
MHFSGSIVGLVAATTLTITQALALPLDNSNQLTFQRPKSPESPPFTLALDQLAIPSSYVEQLKQHISSLPEKRLVKLAENDEPILITEGEKALLVLQRLRFEDVTDEQSFITTQHKQFFPSKLTYNSKALGPIFSIIDTDYMKTFLTKFSSFRTRYYRSETGKQSQQFLLSTLKDIAKTNTKVNVTFTEFPHPWGQNSIIARFEPARWKAESPSSSDEDDDEESVLSEKIVILGGHQDSTNMFPFLPAPGADDDGSGTTTLLMAFKSLVNSSFVPSTNPVEFHWYSAEEGGLLGSQAVAQSYAAAGKTVRSMLQMDMTAFVKAGTAPKIGIITDFVDPDFTDMMRLVVGEYAEIPYVDTKCGYACSDHSSWTKIGAPSAFTIESTFEESNHNIHTSNDKIDYTPEFSFDHMAQFCRVTIALAIELGGGASLGLN